MLIRPGYFASTLFEFKDGKPLHSIAYGKCNYRCAFCSFDKWTVDRYPEFTIEGFEQKVWELLRISKNFKFTGGEPTLNPYLPQLVRIVKIYGARVYLDTNGSRPHVVKKLIDEGLIDILGVSIKGLSAKEAVDTARITNQKLCWDNVFETLALGSQAKDVKVLFTYVACDGYFSEESLEILAQKLEPFPDVVLKINNCYHEEYNDGRRKGLDKSEIYKMVESFVERHPEFKGRTVLFRDHDSCVDSSNTAFF